jgi:hypothetical protein
MYAKLNDAEVLKACTVHCVFSAINVDDHSDYHYHYYGDDYVSVSVGLFEYSHISLPF